MSSSICPLCQQDNRCALTQQQPAAQCWCMQQTFPAKATLAGRNLPSQQCLCQSCVQRLLEEASQGIKRLD
ncbi:MULTISPECIES: cysteine-rich CWC family protein [Shewanella]|uniref:cysteine-rich CWC family protein n=1 Tax=Shewanella TaxID=22 RepID=UPI0004AE7293|nr:MULTISPECIES: cysteine-rich CWC family protein [Shewanella]QLE84132.1 cysteine-rich CWC family protein [Shewanella sp. Scap07]